MKVPQEITIVCNTSFITIHKMKNRTTYMPSIKSSIMSTNSEMSSENDESAVDDNGMFSSESSTSGASVGTTVVSDVTGASMDPTSRVRISSVPASV